MIKIEGELWEIQQGIITAIKYNGEIYNLKKKTQRVMMEKQPFLKKWIKNNNIQRFNIKQFYKVYPRFERKDYQKRLHSTIAKMIEKKELIQLGNDEFQVL